MVPDGIRDRIVTETRGYRKGIDTTTFLLMIRMRLSLPLVMLLP